MLTLKQNGWGLHAGNIKAPTTRFSEQLKCRIEWLCVGMYVVFTYQDGNWHELKGDWVPIPIMDNDLQTWIITSIVRCGSVIQQHIFVKPTLQWQQMLICASNRKLSSSQSCCGNGEHPCCEGLLSKVVKRLTTDEKPWNVQIVRRVERQ